MASACRTFECEHAAISELAKGLDESFARACTLIGACKGHIVVSGIGKSGHIGRKIAATLSSTGTPALFLHPAEAGHGDMGAVTDKDVILAISYSGEATELITLLPLWKRMHLPLIAMTGNTNSSLAKASKVCLNISVNKEACPLNLAPTSSTTVSLVMGDALAVAMLESRDFQASDFALSHPSGSLGRRLLLSVADVMQGPPNMPKVEQQLMVAQALVEVNRCGLGMTTVVDSGGKLSGVFTDGDLRRTLDKRLDIHACPVQECMTMGGHRISADQLAVDALNMMEEHKITAIVCVDKKGQPEGVVHLHQLLRVGLA
jgi:arabinose-5-phosphate isomerase